jgi:hypothetical protein
MEIKFSIFAFGLFLILGSCTPEEEIFVSPELQDYFDRFAVEAGLRGVSFDYERDRIEGYILDISERDVTGKCTYNTHDPDQITVDQYFWRQASDLEKEFLVFHELGHCFLNRTHLDDANPNGTCVSIMHSGLGDCRNAYNVSTRSEYLDELFGLP